jgi:hypothetical protein
MAWDIIVQIGSLSFTDLSAMLEWNRSLHDVREMSVGMSVDIKPTVLRSRSLGVSDPKSTVEAQSYVVNCHMNRWDLLACSCHFAGEFCACQD